MAASSPSDAPPGAASEPPRQLRSLGRLLLILTVTPALFRLVALARVGIPQFTVSGTSGTGEILAAMTLGTLQDLCVATLAVGAALFVARLRGRVAGALLLGFVFVATHLYYLLDLLLYLSRRIRMSATFLEFLKFPQPFLDSAWAAGLGPLLAGAALILGTGALVVSSGFRLLPEVARLDRGRYVTVACLWALWAMTVGGTELLPRTAHYPLCQRT